MGQTKSKASKRNLRKPKRGTGKGIPEIPVESPLGWMLEHWEECPIREGKSKKRMVHFCIEVWGGVEIRDHVIWPVFGTFEEWICKALVRYVGEKGTVEEREYAGVWGRIDAKLLPIRIKDPADVSGDKWEPLDNLPPPYIVPSPPPLPEQNNPQNPGRLGPPLGRRIPISPSLPSAPPLESRTVAPVPPVGLPPPLEPVQATQSLGKGTQSTDTPAPARDDLSPDLDLAAFFNSPENTQQGWAEAKHSPPARRTRRQLKRMNETESEGEGERANLFPLREIPTAPGIIGYVNVPINTSDVRAFKKEMGKLMDDPLGVSERLDEFLGTSIYSYEDLTAILRSLFNTEEREMIRQAGIREWERRNPQSTPGDQKWPSQIPDGMLKLRRVGEA
ncbi:hypothetical protein DUI87_10056 [Hirundo rustica rustica]|uniref:Core shell protein Gag P30 domain-containing protein n=1 Tax=Hirundo rustica rustica TaxID=333673 RepID=A0A3M0KHC6_HIRRU|nr:hypothetical protein DUI87_10056 [Hirundo rustica rustica]